MCDLQAGLSALIENLNDCRSNTEDHNSDRDGCYADDKVLPRNDDAENEDYEWEEDWRGCVNEECNGISMGCPNSMLAPGSETLARSATAIELTS